MWLQWISVLKGESVSFLKILSIKWLCGFDIFSFLNAMSVSLLLDHVCYIYFRTSTGLDDVPVLHL